MTSTHTHSLPPLPPHTQNILCSDKTGTLTLNKMVIQEDCPTWVPGADKASTLQLAALAAKWLEPPADALDTMTLGAADLEAINKEGWTTVDLEPFDASVKRTSAIVHAPSVGYRRVAKGAIHAIMQLAKPGPATKFIEAEADAKANDYASRGVRCMAVGATPVCTTQAEAEAAPVELVGLLTFLDPPRPDTHEVVEKAMSMGVDVKMITGDALVIAKETMRMLNLGTDIISAKEIKWPKVGPDGELPSDLGTTLAPRAVKSDGFAQVFPEHKFAIVEALRQAGFAVGMTGDGVNDAPALKRAHVGIAVAGATDAARAAADIVLTEPGLSAITVAFREARIVFKRISNFILYRMCVVGGGGGGDARARGRGGRTRARAHTLSLTLPLLTHPRPHSAATLYLVAFFFIAVFAIKPSNYNVAYPKYFSLPVLLLLLITALNDGTFVFIGKDTVKLSPRPERWNLRSLFAVASVLAIPPTIGSLLLLHWALDSSHPASLFAKLGLPALPQAKLASMMFLVVGAMSFLTLFAAREQSWGWTSAPHPVLSIASVISLFVTTMLASFWPAPSASLLRNLLSDIPVLGLSRAIPEGGVPGAVGDADLDLRSRTYALWPLWTLLYCFFWFGVQDVFKVVTWKLLLAADAFGLRTGAVVAVRGADTFEDKQAVDAAGTVEGRLLELRVRDAALSVQQALAKVSAAGSTDAALETAASTLAAASDAVTRTVHESEPIFARTASVAASTPAEPSVVPRLGRSSMTMPQRRASLEMAAAHSQAVAAAPAGVPSSAADPAVRLRRMSIAAQNALEALEPGADDTRRRFMRSSVAGLQEAQSQLDAVEAALRERTYRSRGRQGGGGGCGGAPRADVENA